MKEAYKVLYDVANFMKISCVLLAFVYIVLWLFSSFFDLAPFKIIAGFFDNPVTFIRAFGKNEIYFNGNPVDMTYIIVAVILFIVYPFFSMITRYASVKIHRCFLEEIKQKEIDEVQINQELKRELDTDMKMYSRFVVLLELYLEHAISESVAGKRAELSALITKNYDKISSDLKDYRAQEGIYGEGIYFAIDDFEVFDKFLTDLLMSIKNISAQNSSENALTTFTLSVDAIKVSDNTKKCLNELVKIATLENKNKAVTTASFKSRYGWSRYPMEKERKFELVTLGVSRFFEPGTHGYQDFELYSLKVKRPMFLN